MAPLFHSTVPAVVTAIPPSSCHEFSRAQSEKKTRGRFVGCGLSVFSIPSFSQREMSKGTKPGTIPSPCFYPGKISRERKDRPTGATASMSIPRNVDTSQVKFARYANTVVERAYLYAFVRSRRERRGGQVCMCIDASDGIARERDFVDGAYAKRSRFNQLLGISH